MSNGHGEDYIASQLAIELQKLRIDIIALPIVGRGQAYQKYNIEIIGPVQDTMPSGGFVYMDWKQLLGDLKGGLGGLTMRQMCAVRHPERPVDLVLAVGDIVVQLLARWSCTPFVFVGTAKSDYFIADREGPYRRWHRLWLALRAQPHLSVHAPWERWMMKPPRCRAVFPRDSLTALSLKEYGLPVFDLGNPMMDNLDSGPDLQEIPADRPAVLLLPGSRPPEAYRNWALMGDVVRRLPKHFTCYGAIAPSLDLETLRSLWPEDVPPALLISGQFASCARRADVVLGMAGTANEQCVGLGKAVVTLPGEGPQFTSTFAETQQRLLGISLRLAPDPASAASFIQQELDSPRDLRANARERMGHPGAACRIATKICKILEVL